MAGKKGSNANITSKKKNKNKNSKQFTDGTEFDSLLKEQEEINEESEETLYKNSLNRMLSTVTTTSIGSIEALPYQFLPNVDRRINKANENGKNSKMTSNLGRKYTEKILSRMPLLFLMPCTAKFMADENDSSVATSAMFTSTIAAMNGVLNEDAITTLTQLLGGDYKQEKSARYYGTEFAYAGYYNYLQTMLTILAHYLGIEDKKVYYRGNLVKIGDIDWSLQNTGEDELAHYLSGSEALAFYMDGIDTVSETFNNETTTPSVASEFIDKGEQARQLRFLFGNKADSANTILKIKAVGSRVSQLLNGVTGIANGDSSGIEDIFTFATNYMNSAMYRDLLAQTTSTVFQGGRIIFPEIWNDSTYSKNYNISIKLRSPDHDSVSIFMNIFVPYCKLLALVLPHTDASVNLAEEDDANKDSNSYMNPNTYFAPYLIKAFSPGSINVDMGIVDSLSISKGATCQWNADGLPTQIDVDLSIKDLYSTLAMSGWGQNVIGFNLSKIWAAVSNTAYMDYLANMAGLNVKDTHRRKVDMAKTLTLARIKNTGARLYTHFSNKISNYVKAFYDW